MKKILMITILCIGINNLKKLKYSVFILSYNIFSNTNINIVTQ